jgi:hypothetical protein
LNTRLHVVVVAAIVARAAVLFAVPLRVTIDGTRAKACRSGVVTVTPACAAEPCAGETTVPWRLDESGRAAVIVDAPAVEQRSVTAHAEGCWSLDVHIGPENSDAAMRLWRSAVVTGRLRFPEKQKSPLSVSVGIESSSEGVPATNVQCPVADGRFRCTVPAAVLDLRIAPEGWAPRYLWGVASHPDAPVEAGDVTFERGGAITGFVRFAGDGPPLPEVNLELVPALPDATTSVAEGKRQIVGRTERVHPSTRGFFQFRHLDPGPYTVIARADGWSPAREPELRVEDGRETRLDNALVIEPLARVEVLLMPPLDPRGEPWRVSLSQVLPLNGGAIPVAEGNASLIGQWSAEGVDAAMHLLRVADQRGNGFARTVIEVSSHMAPVQLTINAIGIDGTVRIGEKPLETRLEFRHREGQRVSFRSDAEGRFSGTLPDEGRWEIDVAMEGKQMMRRTVEVRRDDGGTARVDLELPDTSVDVAVVSKSGKSVRAQVRVFDGKGRYITGASTDDHGRVRLLGLDSEEELQLSARTRSEGLESGAYPVTFDADGHAEMTIVMQSQIKVRGWLVTPTGRPVAGAFVRYVAPYRKAVLEEVSGPSGEFEIALPHDAGILEMIILPPAMPIKLLTIPVHAEMDPNLEIVVGGPPATLELAMSSSPPFPFIRRDGGAMSAIWLQYPFNWTLAPHQWRPWGMVLTLEAGTYAVCSNTGANCKTLSLTPGAIERVDGRELLQ